MERMRVSWGRTDFQSQRAQPNVKSTGGEKFFANFDRYRRLFGKRYKMGQVTGKEIPPIELCRFR